MLNLKCHSNFSELHSSKNMSRVVSKRLFDFPLTGLYDDDVAAHDAETMEQLVSSKEGMEIMQKMMELSSKDDTESNMQYVTIFRDMMDGLIKPYWTNNPILDTAMAEITVKEIKVPTTHDGEFDVPVFKYTPKKLETNGAKQVAYIYAHGGGAVGIEASTYKPILAYYAVDCNVVVFNVDYRIAPETKCPNNVKDFYEVVKYVHANADMLGIDSNKIVIGGESGGGYITLGAMVLLAQRDEGNLVKLAIPSIPMVDDYAYSDPASMTIEEREFIPNMRKIWTLIADDFDRQKNDPLLFPGKASDELLEKFPPTIVEEVEFDMYITEATRLANRLRRAGRLLEFVVVPGAKHGSNLNPALKCFKVAADAKKLMFRHYVHD